MWILTDLTISLVETPKIITNAINLMAKTKYIFQKQKHELKPPIIEKLISYIIKVIPKL